MSVTNVALPSIAADLDATGIQIHWIGAGFTVALTSLVLLAGAIDDRYGRQLLFLLGGRLSIPTAILSALSSTPGELIAWRMAAGLAAALLFPTTLSLITNLYAHKEEGVRAIAGWTGVSAAGAALGSPVAGFLHGSISWASICFVPVPLAGIALVAGWFLLPSISHEGAAPVDWVGGVLTIVFASTLLYGIIELPVIGLSGEVLAYFAVSALALFGFVTRQLRVRHPLLDLCVFGDMRFTIASITVTMLSFGLAGVMYLAAQYLQNVLGYDPMNAGLAVMPIALMALVASPISARLGSKIGGGGLLCWPVDSASHHCGLRKATTGWWGELRIDGRRGWPCYDAVDQRDYVVAPGGKGWCGLGHERCDA
jgi:MFS family permease